MRLAVLTDRLPTDRDWKGAYIWQLILSLAESQHDVTVFTTLDPAEIDIQHPRLNIARPANSWKISRLLPWLQALMSFQPDVIHTFALQNTKTLPGFSLWPYLNSAFQLVPKIRRVCTLFEPADWEQAHSASTWYLGAERWTLFTSAMKYQLPGGFKGEIEIAPLDVSRLDSLDADSTSTNTLLIPTPVTEWRQPFVDLCLLADYLQNHREVEVEILGGWGQMTSAQKREGWDLLHSVCSQVRMSSATSLESLATKIRHSAGLWLRPLPPDTWAYFVSQELAERMNKPVYGPKLQLIQGSTANFMSRLYTNS